MKVCRVKGAASTFVIKKWVKKLPRLNSLLKIDSYPLFLGCRISLTFPRIYLILIEK